VVFLACMRAPVIVQAISFILIGMNIGTGHRRLYAEIPQEQFPRSVLVTRPTRPISS